MVREDRPVQHAMNVVTMATWLSVAGFSLLAAIAPHRKLAAVIVKAEKSTALDITLDAVQGGEKAVATRELPSSSAPPPLRALPVFRTTRRPPAMPSLPVVAPLPAVPSLPAPRAVPANQRPTQASAPAGNSSRERVAAGYMPASPYPPFSVRNRQEGTVIVEFAVNSEGVVTAVFVKVPCRWPLLNQAAVRTVYNWRFPPGDFITLERPVVFKLQ